MKEKIQHVRIANKTNSKVLIFLIVYKENYLIDERNSESNPDILSNKPCYVILSDDIAY